MTSVKFAERGDTGRFVPIVNFLSDPRSSFTGDRLHINLHAQSRTCKTQKCHQQLGVGQIIADSAGHARILDFHRDVATITQDRVMNLTDRRGRHRSIVKLGELLDRAPQLGLENFMYQHRTHTRCVGLQSDQRLLIGREPACSQRNRINR